MLRRVRHLRHRFAAWKDVVNIPNFIELWFVAVSKLYVCKRRRVRFSHYYFGDSRNVHSPADGLNMCAKAYKRRSRKENPASEMLCRQPT